MSQHIKNSLGLLIVLLFITSANAEEPKDGMHGMLWGSSVEQHTHLIPVREAAPVSYYVNANMNYMVSNQPVPEVIYGYYEGQFFAVYIKLRSPDQFFNLTRHFTSKYGKPKEDHIAHIQQTVYRWKESDIKIKLKMTESTGNIKLAIYYSPIAAQLNQAMVENLPKDIPGVEARDDNQPSKSPLFRNE
jgi:hypothetical protein